MSEFQDRVVFVSGVARGQGRSHAVRFAELGAKVVGFDLCAQLDEAPYALSTREDLDETVALVEAAGGQIEAAVADVRDQTQVDAVLAKGLARFGGRLHVASANAGIVVQSAKSWEITDAMFRATLDVNLLGAWHTMKAAALAMRASGGPGSIVATGSGMSVKAAPNIAAYVASKHGLAGLVRVMARELAPQHIRVNAVLPGNANTLMFNNDMIRRLYVPEAQEPTEEAFLERAAAGVPMGVPYVEPADITDAVVWLASDASKRVTGTLLGVDGGSAIP